MEFARRMNQLYPDVLTVIGTVEGFPALEDVLETLKHADVKRVVLKPFMVVAGDHACNDMAGEEDDSWKSVMEKNGIKVVAVKKGLRENDRFAEIFVKHLDDAALDSGIHLK
jgi:sirohydrochlorin cobaltochelatase